MISKRLKELLKTLRKQKVDEVYVTYIKKNHTTLVNIYDRDGERVQVDRETHDEILFVSDELTKSVRELPCVHLRLQPDSSEVIINTSPTEYK